MKLPRGVSADRLIRALEHCGYSSFGCTVILCTRPGSSTTPIRYSAGLIPIPP